MAIAGTGTASGLARSISSTGNDTKRARFRLQLGSEGSPEPEEQDYERWLSAGRERIARIEHSQAKAALFLAEQKVPAGAEDKRALVVAYQALASNELNDFSEAERLAIKGFGLLGIADPRRHPFATFADLRDRLVRDSDKAWLALSELVTLWGRQAQDHRDFVGARSLYRVLTRIAEHRGSEPDRATAAHRLATVGLDAAAALETRPRGLWVPMPASLLIGVQTGFEEARRHRGGDQLGGAFDLLGEAEAGYLLGGSAGRDPKKADADAEEAFGDGNPARVHLLRRRGRRAMAEYRDGDAATLLDEATSIAWTIGSDHLYASSCGWLGELSHARGNRRSAIERYAAALLAWPLPIHRHEYDRFGELLSGLRPTKGEISNALGRTDSPLAALAELPAFRARLQERIWTPLRVTMR